MPDVKEEAPVVASAPVLAPIKLLYDTWDAEGNRHPAGTVIGLPAVEARKLLVEGKGERADPLPGE